MSISRMNAGQVMPRRDFLKTLGAGAVVAVIPGQLSAEEKEKLSGNPETKIQASDSSKLTIDHNLKDEKYETRLQEIIDNATKAGVLKGQNDFTKIVSASRDTSEVTIVEDPIAYKKYIDGIKARARGAFPDNIGDLSSFLSGIYKGKKARVLDSTQSEVLIAYYDYRVSENITGRINGGLNSIYDLSKLKTWVKEQIQLLDQQK